MLGKHSVNELIYITSHQSSLKSSGVGGEELGALLKLSVYPTKELAPNLKYICQSKRNMDKR